MTARGNALISFHGMEVDEGIAALFSDSRVAGAMFYLPLNIDNAGQTRRLTDDLRKAAGRSILVAVDQEGGQLMAAGPEMTPFAGNMALGAAGDTDLTRRVGAAIGRELRAVGINVNLAPVADVATRPYNPSMGIRSFGEDPGSVSAHTDAFVVGLQSEGVAATLKHFPGKGEATVDPHHELPILHLEIERLNAVEFAPFRAGIAAGAKLIMVGHYGLPAVTGEDALPTSVSSDVLRGLLRGHLGFDGIVITDALDMGGFGDFRPETSLHAGADLLLYGPAQAGTLPESSPSESSRIQAVLGWLDGFDDPAISAVGCDEHLDLAREVARRAITLVRDDSGAVPLQLESGDRVLAVMPEPTNLTPADTSGLVAPVLARAIRRHHRATTEMLVSFDPTRSEIDDAVQAATEHAVVVLGTIDATAGQAELAQALIGSGARVVVVSMRTPYDLVSLPEADTYVCTYGVLEFSLDALADALFGHSDIEGSLPVAIPGLYPVGHGIRRIRSGTGS